MPATGSRRPSARSASARARSGSKRSNRVVRRPVALEALEEEGRKLGRLQPLCIEPSPQFRDRREREVVVERHARSLGPRSGPRGPTWTGFGALGARTLTRRMATPLLETKLYAPRRRRISCRGRAWSTLLDRGARREADARLGARRASARRRSSPSGSRPTRAAAQPRGSRSTPATTTPASFWSYVVAALQTAASRASAPARSRCCESRSRLAGRRRSPRSSTTSPRVPGRRRARARRLPRRSTSPRSTTGMAFLLDHLPPNVHVVIATRADPPLPARAAAGAGRAGRDPRGRPAVHARRGRGLPQRRDGPRLTPATSRRSRRGPRAGSRRCSSRPCRCRAATTSPRSSRGSPATTATSSTTSSRRSCSASPSAVRAFLLRDLDPRSADAARCATPSPARTAARRRSRRSTGRTCSSSRSTIGGAGTATTTCSPTCSAPGCSTSSRSVVPELHRRASAWFEADGEPAEAIRHALAARRLRAGRGPHRAGDPATLRRDRQEADAAALARRAPGRGHPRPARCWRSSTSGAPDVDGRRSTGSRRCWPRAERSAATRRSESRRAAGHGRRRRGGVPRPARRRSPSIAPACPAARRRRRHDRPRPRGRSSSPARTTTSDAAARPPARAGLLDDAAISTRVPAGIAAAWPASNAAGFGPTSSAAHHPGGHPDRAGPARRRAAALRARAWSSRPAPGGHRCAARPTCTSGLSEILARAERPRGARSTSREPRSWATRTACPQNPYRWRVALARIRQAEGELDEARRAAR